MSKFTNRMIAWVRHAKPGDRFVYAHSATQVRRGENGQTRDARVARCLSDMGLVNLFHRRVSRDGARDGGGLFDYIMIRTEKRHESK